MIIIQPKKPFMGVIFDEDHDFEGPRAPKAHPDTVLTNLSRRPGRPFIYALTTRKALIYVNIYIFEGENMRKI